ncbi:MAG: hypothetical protein ACR2HR_04420 [Euzebya sp.]
MQSGYTEELGGEEDGENLGVESRTDGSAETLDALLEELAGRVDAASDSNARDDVGIELESDAVVDGLRADNLRAAEYFETLDESRAPGGVETQVWLADNGRGKVFIQNGVAGWQVVSEEFAVPISEC